MEHQNSTTREGTPERVNAFSDGVFAIIITIMVLELKKPESAEFSALVELWPTWLSYIVSYLFIAIVWVNHHYLFRHALKTSTRLIWANFIHLFAVSLIPFLTDWISETRFAPVPVAMYAFIFLLVNITYVLLIYETIGREGGKSIALEPRLRLGIRSLLTLALFTIAMIVAFWYPYFGFGIVCGCLISYLRPELPDKKSNIKVARKSQR